MTARSTTGPDQLAEMWRPQLVALDIDGTLVDAKNQLSPVVDAAVRAVAGTGSHVVLSTGRGLTATRPLALHFDLPTPYLVCSNGAVTIRLHNQSDPPLSPAGIIDERGVELIDVVTFDPEPVVRMLLSRLPEVLVAVEELGVGYRVNAHFPAGELTGEIEVQSISQLVAQPATRVILREPSIEAEQFLDVVDRVGLHGVAYYIGYTAWLDLAPEGVSKATGLAKIAERLGVEREDVLAIGDGDNDAEMLSWAGRGVAMGNAAMEVKEVADDVTASLDDDGVAVELSRWFSEVELP
ncbi:HAD family hydrolase [Actinopolymorpha pittospori]|uniref:Hydroxymethylpyrimidine pyrophosphatase-like HAD family hydrolase n=1 Tax=Actinopolymorpha pittospori TaxID=648752 RepID=A0A927MTB5_9ACTN|nr:hydroxymethylpyrimidine pyrophosphatase-like HAD family hydrolase [Actinopolymorpha pittospori]